MSTIIFITFLNIEIFYGFSLSYVVLCKVILLRGDATETGCMTDCRLRSDSDLRQQSVTRPVSVASPLNNITLLLTPAIEVTYY